jgi:hypothetical protein
VAIRFSAFKECHCPEGNLTNKHEFGREQKLQNVTIGLKKLTLNGSNFENLVFSAAFFLLRDCEQKLHLILYKKILQDGFSCLDRNCGME